MRKHADWGEVYRLRSRLAVAITAVLAWAGPTAAWSQDSGLGLSAELVAEKKEYEAEEPVSVRFILTNTGTEALQVLRWNTPLEGFFAEMFEVTLDGKPVPYLGIVLKRGFPELEDWATLEPEGSLSATVDLAEVYHFSKPGTYRVQLDLSVIAVATADRATLKDPRGEGWTFVRFNKESTEVAMKVSRPLPQLGDEEGGSETGGIDPNPGGTTVGPRVHGESRFFRCSKQEKSTLHLARSGGLQLADDAAKHLAQTPVADRSSSARYSRWFGTYSAGNWGQVSSNMQAIRDALQNETLRFRCNCSLSAWAYVRPSDPYKIWLCNRFWTSPRLGADSQAGTLIHEVSHFTVVAGTLDVAYGMPACETLATNSPAQAIQNADSHEYFAENDAGEN